MAIGSVDMLMFCGYVDVGNGANDDDPSPVAKEALVFLAVNVNSLWKVPGAYLQKYHKIYSYIK